MRIGIYFLTLILSLSTSAHSGRTDSSGGHNCSAKSKAKGLCTGYHYHNGGGHLTKPKTYPVDSPKVVGPYTTLYNRSDWPHWIDEDHDCQDTRAELLITQSKLPVKYRNSKKCSVVAGSWYDPYSGKTWIKASDVDIDHIVPLKWAHGHGAQSWSKKKKREFANDLENLLIVEDSLNQSKGAKSPDEWMPPNHTYRCEYVVKFDAIVSKYQLKYIPSEARIIRKMLSKCND
ncbi:HNH endonuclease [Pleionea sediminis]|uniref:HNH endonuclease n=1 Tax=Pleionea sediminis TaxID=2569479 RepID=UPI001185F420|nr:HNH endonuclease [Pleionea sediminis]